MSPAAPKRSAAPSTWPITLSTSSPYRSVIFSDTQTPRRDIGTEPMSIQPARRARTFPMRRCWTAPTDLNTAPWAMSVPIAVEGEIPNRKMRIGVMSDPPPMPVIPTRIPVKRPASTNSQSMGVEGYFR